MCLCIPASLLAPYFISLTCLLASTMQFQWCENAAASKHAGLLMHRYLRAAIIPNT